MAVTNINNKGSFDYHIDVTPAKNKSFVNPKIETKIRDLQQLWTHYEQKPCSLIYGDILRDVKELESLLKHVPHGEGHDFALACRLSLEVNPHTIKAAENTANHRKEVVQVLAENGLHLHNVEGDGNCAIRAALAGIDPELNTKEIVHTIRGDTMNELERACMDEINNHWDEVLRGTALLVPTIGDHKNSKAAAIQLVKDYIVRMSRDGAWFGERELLFLAKVLGVQINVYDPSKLEIDRKERQVLFNDLMSYGNSDNVINIFRDSYHYQALRRA